MRASGWQEEGEATFHVYTTKPTVFSGADGLPGLMDGELLMPAAHEGLRTGAAHSAGLKACLLALHIGKIFPQSFFYFKFS